MPHVHFNTWLDGTAVDPFPCEGETSLWRAGSPIPFRPGNAPDEFVGSAYDDAAVHAVIDACRTPAVRTELRALRSPMVRAARTLIEMNYYPPDAFSASTELIHAGARARRTPNDAIFRSSF